MSNSLQIDKCDLMINPPCLNLIIRFMKGSHQQINNQFATLQKKCQKNERNIHLMLSINNYEIILN